MILESAAQAHRPPPLLIAIGGLVGTGKTTLAQALLPHLPNAVLIDADIERKKLFGVGLYDKLPDDAYSSENIGLFIEHIRRVQYSALQRHGIVLLTGVWLSAATRQGVADICAAAGAQQIGLWLEAELSTLFNRLQQREKENSYSDADVDVLKRMISREIARPQNDPVWYMINADQPIEKVTADALNVLQSRQVCLQHLNKQTRARQLN